MATPPTSNTVTTLSDPETRKDAINKPNTETGQFSFYTVNKVSSVLSAVIPPETTINPTQSSSLESRTTSSTTQTTNSLVSCLKSEKLRNTLILTGKIIAIIILSLLIIGLPIAGVLGICIAYATLSNGLIIGGLLSVQTLPLTITFLSMIIPKIMGNKKQSSGIQPNITSDNNKTLTENIYRNNNLEKSVLIKFIDEIQAHFDNEELRQQLTADKLFKITVALHNLNFLDDLEPYQKARNTLLQFLSTKTHLTHEILQVAQQRDKQAIEALQHSLHEEAPLSLEQLEQLSGLFSEACPLEEYGDTMTSLQSDLAEKLITEQIPWILENELDIPSPESDYDKSNDPSELMRVSGSRNKMTHIDSCQQTYLAATDPKSGKYYCPKIASIFSGEHTNDDITGICLHTQACIDKLHHIKMIMLLISKVYQYRSPTLKLSDEQRNNIQKCLEIYEQSRNELIKHYKTTTDYDDTAIPENPINLWALQPIARYLKRSWLVAHDLCPLNEHQKCAKDKDFDPTSEEDMFCSITCDSFENMAPDMECTDNIALLATTKQIVAVQSTIEHIQERETTFRKNSHEPAECLPLTNWFYWSGECHLVDIIPVEIVIPLTQFAFQNILPQTPEICEFMTYPAIEVA